MQKNPENCREDDPAKSIVDATGYLPIVVQASCLHYILCRLEARTPKY